MSRSGAEIIANENRSKFIQSRISRVEHNFGKLCSALSSYTRKTARLRNKGDQICGVLREYVDSELINMSTKTCIRQFADNLTAIQDYRQAQVNRLEANIVKPLCSYGNICKDAKVDIRAALGALEKEQRSVKTLQRASMRQPNNDTLLYRARAEVDQATLLSIRTSKDLHGKTEMFERKKLHDLKKILLDFVKIEMIFHAKALEVYTKCFHSVNAIHPETDFTEFRKYFFPAEQQMPSYSPIVSPFPSPKNQFGNFGFSSSNPAALMPFANPLDSTPVPLQPSAYGLVYSDGIPHFKMNIDTIDEEQEQDDDKKDNTDSNSNDENDDIPRMKKVTLNNLVQFDS